MTAAWLFRSLLLLACLAFAAQAPAEARTRMDPAALANKAIRQPMLAERITKLYTQVGQKLLETRTQRALATAVKEFEVGLKELLAAAPTAEIRDNYQLLDQLWDEYKSIAVRAPNLESAKKLAEQNEEVVWIATKGARLVVEHSRTRQTELVRTAGEVRVLSQRIAKLYLFRSWGIRSSVIAADLKAADTEYRLAMAVLRNAPQNTHEIRSEIQLADNQYLFLEQSIQRLDAGQEVRKELEFVAKTCDNILEVMERVARLYESGKA